MSAVTGGSIGRRATELHAARPARPAAGRLARWYAELRANLLKPNHDPALDGLRGVAVGLVFLVHIHRLVGPLAAEGETQFWLRAVAATGQVGVLLFFALSGFLVYRIVLEGRPAYRRFMRRRIKRIYPTFLAVALLYLTICVAWPAMSKLPSGAAALTEYVARALVLLPGLEPTPPLITVAWTLRYEMSFYLLVGALVFLPGFFRLRAPARIALALGVLAVLFWSSRMMLASTFVFGILAYEAHQALKDREVRTRAAAWIALLASIPASFYMYLPELALEYPTMPAFILEAGVAERYLALGPILMAIVTLAALGGNVIATFAAWAPVRAFGIISYSYYLSHGIALHFSEKVLLPAALSGGDPTVNAFAMFAVTFALSVALAVFLFVTVEFPFSLRRPAVY